MAALHTLLDHFFSSLLHSVLELLGATLVLQEPLQTIAVKATI